MGDSYEAVRPGRRRQNSTNRFTLARVHTGPEGNAATGEGKLSDRASADVGERAVPQLEAWRSQTPHMKRTTPRRDPHRTENDSSESWPTEVVAQEKPSAAKRPLPGNEPPPITLAS